jgi:hypothetical protein
MILAADLQQRIRRKHIARLGDPAFTTEDFASEDERLSPRTGIGQPTINQQLIGARAHRRSHLHDKSNQPILRIA